MKKDTLFKDFNFKTNSLNFVLPTTANLFKKNNYKTYISFAIEKLSFISFLRLLELPFQKKNETKNYFFLYAIWFSIKGHFYTKKSFYLGIFDFNSSKNSFAFFLWLYKLLVGQLKHVKKLKKSYINSSRLYSLLYLIGKPRSINLKLGNRQTKCFS